jgi:hypothetical protein
MTTYTIDPINNKMVSNNDSKDLKRLKDLKKEKPFQKILQNKVKPLSAEETIALQNRNYDTWGLLKATAQTPAEKKELREIVERKYEKKPVDIQPMKLNLNFYQMPSIVDKTVEQHLADTEREYYKNYEANINENLSKVGIGQLYRKK